MTDSTTISRLDLNRDALVSLTEHVIQQPPRQMSLVRRYVPRVFSEEYLTTIGVKIGRAPVRHKGQALSGDIAPTPSCALERPPCSTAGSSN